MARPSYPSDTIDKLLLRFPEGMRERLKQSADAKGRSLNAEIIQRLKHSLAEDDDPATSNWKDAFFEQLQGASKGDAMAAVLALQGGRFLWIDSNSETRGYTLRSDSSKLLNEAVEALEKARFEKSAQNEIFARTKLASLRSALAGTEAKRLVDHGIVSNDIEQLVRAALEAALASYDAWEIVRDVTQTTLQSGTVLLPGDKEMEAEARQEIENTLAKLPSSGDHSAD